MRPREVTLNGARYPLLSDPVDHILVKTEARFDSISNKERLLINPYNGCSHRCLFCFVNNRMRTTTYRIFRNTGVVTVFATIVSDLRKRCDMVDVDGVAYLSPGTDPFQPLNQRYELSELLIEELARRGIPVAVCTKARLSERVLDCLQKNPRSFCELSILTLCEDVRKQLVPGGGATVQEQLELFAALNHRGIRHVARIDPIYPWLTDTRDMLVQLLDELQQRHVRTVVTSCAKIPVLNEHKCLEDLDIIDCTLREKYAYLYCLKDSVFLYADIAYRLDLFRFLKRECHVRGIDLRLCLEKDANGNDLQGLI